MSQKKKSKTKKQMKKSINSLWTSLQEEKAKHAKASAIVGHLKQDLDRATRVVTGQRAALREMNHNLAVAGNREEHTTEVMAGLVKALT